LREVGTRIARRQVRASSELAGERLEQKAA